MDSMQLWELVEQSLPLHLVLSLRHSKSAREEKPTTNESKETWERTGTHVSITTSSFDVLGSLPEKLILFPQSCIYTGPRTQKISRRRSSKNWRSYGPHCHGTWWVPSQLADQWQYWASSPPASYPALTFREWQIQLCLTAGFQIHIKCLFQTTPIQNHIGRGILRNSVPS